MLMRAIVIFPKFSLVVLRVIPDRIWIIFYVFEYSESFLGEQCVFSLPAIVVCICH